MFLLKHVFIFYQLLSLLSCNSMRGWGPTDDKYDLPFSPEQVSSVPHQNVDVSVACYFLFLYPIEPVFLVLSPCLHISLGPSVPCDSPGHGPWPSRLPQSDRFHQSWRLLCYLQSSVTRLRDNNFFNKQMKILFYDLGA